MRKNEKVKLGEPCESSSDNCKHSSNLQHFMELCMKFEPCSFDMILSFLQYFLYIVDFFEASLRVSETFPFD